MRSTDSDVCLLQGLNRSETSMNFIVACATASSHTTAAPFLDMSNNEAKQPGIPTSQSPTQLPSNGHKCPVCPKTFAYQSLLRRHLTSHTGERPFPCPYCPHRSQQKANLEQHMATHGVFKMKNKKNSM